MRRADVLWTYSALGATFTDVTQTLGAGRSPITLQPNDKLYVGHRDWLAGVELIINSAPVDKPTIIPETYDGSTNTWQELPVQEFVEQEETGAQVGVTFDYRSSGVVSWETSPWLWVRKKAASGFPENARPPVAGGQSTPEKFWVRLRNTGTVAVQIDRCLPSLYNTYATHEDVAHFLGVQEFNEDTDPIQSFVKERIREWENWLDTHCRRSWRLRMMLRDRYDFNPYGVRLRGAPVWFATRAGVWTGSSFTALTQGRNQDYWVEQRTGFLYFTRISLGRGLPWSRAASRYLRQPMSMEIDYVYGEDYDTAPHRGQVQGIILRKVAIDLTQQSDYTAILYGGPDAMPKPEKIRQWATEAEERSDEMRTLWTV